MSKRNQRFTFFFFFQPGVFWLSPHCPSIMWTDSAGQQVKILLLLLLLVNLCVISDTRTLSTGLQNNQAVKHCPATRIQSLRMMLCTRRPIIGLQSSHPKPRGPPTGRLDRTWHTHQWE
jgi:hypothetical protein